MPDSPASEPSERSTPSPPRRSWWWKWTRRLLKIGAFISIACVVLLFAARAYFRHTGKEELTVETAKLDAEEPGWRLPERLAAREKAAPPDEQNSALVVRRVRTLIPQEWTEWAKRPTPDGDEPVPLNRKQYLEDVAGDAHLIAATREARDLGATLSGHPHGYHAVEVPDVPLLIKLEETQGAREVARLLKTDATVAAQSGDSVRAIRDAHAILNTGRSIGDEPTLISSLVRFACGQISAETTMRVLALCDTKEALPELAALQVALAAEAEEPIFLNGLRGELALINLLFERLETGTLTPDRLATEAKMGGTSVEVRAFFYFQRAFLLGDQARFQRHMLAFISAAKRPPHEQHEAFSQVEATIRADRDLRYPFSGLMLPACQKVAEASLRHRAGLLTASVLIACERFRVTRGRWPESLAEVPKELLPAIPIDPYDGKPLKFAKLTDGIAVYTAGAGPTPDRDIKRLTNPLGGTEIGWRLYDPPARCLPPLNVAPFPHEPVAELPKEKEQEP